jgi:hypothetical protein
MPDVCSEAALHAWISHILHDRWPRGGRPEGLRLELSPLAANRVLSCEHMRWDLPAFTPDMGYPEILTKKFGLPVHVMKELEPGAWRLAVVTDEMLDEGKLGPDAIVFRHLAFDGITEHGGKRDECNWCKDGGKYERVQ